MEFSIQKDSKYNIKPPESKIEEGINLPLDCPLQRSFVSIIVGPPYSGKSYLISQLITDARFYAKKFNFLYVLSPKQMPGLDLDDDNHCTKWDINWLTKKLNQHILESKLHYINIIVIIDDFITELNMYEKCQELFPLITNRRHFYESNEKQKGCIHFIITTQKYTMLPAKIRSQQTSVFFFKVLGIDYECIRKECLPGTKLKVIDSAINMFLYNDKIKHNFVYVDLSNSLIYFNFDKLKV